MNSFERLSKIFGGGENLDEEMECGVKAPAVQTTPKPLIGKKPDKLPPKKKDVVTKSKIRGPKKGHKNTLRTSSKK